MVLAALGSLASVLVVPWAWYGDIDVPLHRLPVWGVHLAAVLVVYAAVLGTLLVPVRHRGLALAGAVGASVAGAGTAVLVASGYDDASALFGETVPAVLPRLGPGPFLAVLAVLVGLGAAVLFVIRERRRVDSGAVGRV
jgi:hypothetical protein